MINDLPAPYRLRRATPSDAPAVVDLIAACDIAQRGETERWSAEDIVGDISGVDGETIAWVAEAPDGSLACYGTASNRGSGQLSTDGYVPPEHRGRGLGTALIHLTEECARTFIPAAPE